MFELQPFTKADIPILLSWIESEAFLVQWSGHYFTYPLTTAQVESHYLRTRSVEPDCIAFKAISLRNEECVGHVELEQIDRLSRSACVARLLVGKKEHRGRGIGSEILRQLLQFAFESMKLNSLSVNTVVFNLPAIACYKNFGFEVAEMINENSKIGDKYWSPYRMTLDREKWEEIAAGGR